MPVKWHDPSDQAPAHPGAFSFAAGDAPGLQVTLWPHRSLPPRGFALVITITFAMFLLPLSLTLGTPAHWGLLPFLMGTLALVWYALRRSTADGALNEVLSLWDDRIELIRHNPRKPDQSWHANPHWVQLQLHPETGPVENYVTLRGNERTVEIGAFLSPEERLDLYQSLCRWIG